jgi:hypothetical protein
MSQQFPLYTTLNNNLANKDLTKTQKDDFMKKIESMDSEGHDLIYALIKCFYLENTKSDHLSVPYNGEISKDKITFDLQQFPNPLKQLLYKFIILNGKKRAEDKKIQDEINASSLAEKEK